MASPVRQFSGTALVGARWLLHGSSNSNRVRVISSRVPVIPYRVPVIPAKAGIQKPRLKAVSNCQHIVAYGIRVSGGSAS